MKALNNSVQAIYGSSVTLMVRVCSQPAVLDLMWVTPERRSHVFPGETKDRYTFLNLTVSSYYLIKISYMEALQSKVI